MHGPLLFTQIFAAFVGLVLRRPTFPSRCVSFLPSLFICIPSTSTFMFGVRDAAGRCELSMSTSSSEMFSRRGSLPLCGPMVLEPVGNAVRGSALACTFWPTGPPNSLACSSSNPGPDPSSALINFSSSEQEREKIGTARKNSFLEMHGRPLMLRVKKVAKIVLTERLLNRKNKLCWELGK